MNSISDLAGAAADLKKARRNRDAVERVPTDKLPPHDVPAEQALLGGCLGGKFGELEKSQAAFNRAREQFGLDEVFYDLRHQSIWHALAFLKEKDGQFDVITLQAELKARDLLDQIGGLPYLMTLPEIAPLDELFENHVALVWEKYLARRLLQNFADAGGRVYESGELTESHIANIEEKNKEWRALLERGAVTPKNLCAPNQFADAYYDAFFNRHEESYGYELPFHFPLRWRPSEMTLFTGEDGSGKSSMLSLIAIVSARQMEPGQKVVVASMEVPPEITLWIMARQLLGLGKLEKTEENIARVVKALGWLQKRILIYNFLGITDWRELLNTFRYAREHAGGELFIVDSVMRIGIEDDNYAMQGIASSQFAEFSVKTGAHTILVHHQNKSGDGGQKTRVRGSKQWTDNAHNVVGTKRNEAKATKLAELKAERDSGEMDQTSYDNEVRQLTIKWDSQFLLSKQRWPGSRQNGARYLYFHHESLQFHEKPNQAAIDYTLK